MHKEGLIERLKECAVSLKRREEARWCTQEPRSWLCARGIIAGLAWQHIIEHTGRNQANATQRSVPASRASSRISVQIAHKKATTTDNGLFRTTWHGWSFRGTPFTYQRFFLSAPGVSRQAVGDVGN